MELTRQHFDKQIKSLKSEMSGMATKTDLAEVKAKMATKTDLAEVRSEMATKTDLLALRDDLDNSIESLARMVQSGFEDVIDRLDVTERVTMLEKDMKHVKSVIKIK